MWEYHFVTLQGNAIENILDICNSLGLDQWELVTFIVVNGAMILAFKRQVQGEIDV